MDDRAIIDHFFHTYFPTYTLSGICRNTMVPTIRKRVKMQNIKMLEIKIIYCFSYKFKNRFHRYLEHLQDYYYSHRIDKIAK